MKKPRAASTGRWHLDEMVCCIGGKRMYLWRAVDDKGEVLHLVVQEAKDTTVEPKLLERLLKNQPVAPERVTTDGLRSRGAALGELGHKHLQHPGGLRDNNRTESREASWLLASRPDSSAPLY